MAGDEDDGSRRRRRMDLNLYLGHPLSPLSRTGDLGSSLALSPLLSPSPPAAVLEPDYLLDTPLDPVPPPAGYEHLVPYSPDSPSADPSVGSHDRADLGPNLPISPPADEPSSRAEYLRHLESHLHRTIDADHRPMFRRFRRSYNLNVLDDIPQSPSERLMQDIMSSQRDLEASWKRRGRAGVAVAEESEGDLEEKVRGAANFECNVCLDMAKDPVVTRCGHLFCWACLYQWLHLYCDHSECPVCKGLVDEAQITPIYGRGCSKTTEEEKCGGEDGGFELKIPTRPRGHRTESWRQQLHRSIAGRTGGILPLGSSTSDENDVHMQRFLNGTRRSSLTRLLRMQRREVSTESGSNTQGFGLPREEMAGPLVNSSSSLIRDEILEGFTNRLAAISVDLRGAIRTLRTVSGQAGPSSSTSHHVTESWPPWETTLAADQASVSSTMAVIQEEIPANDASAEPRSAGSSRDIRRRGWSSTTGSLDVDGDELHSRKRRRLN